MLISIVSKNRNANKTPSSRKWLLLLIWLNVCVKEREREKRDKKTHFKVSNSNYPGSSTTTIYNMNRYDFTKTSLTLSLRCFHFHIAQSYGRLACNSIRFYCAHPLTVDAHAISVDNAKRLTNITLAQNRNNEMTEMCVVIENVDRTKKWWPLMWKQTILIGIYYTMAVMHALIGWHFCRSDHYFLEPHKNVHYAGAVTMARGENIKDVNGPINSFFSINATCLSAATRRTQSTASCISYRLQCVRRAAEWQRASEREKEKIWPLCCHHGSIKGARMVGLKGSPLGHF